MCFLMFRHETKETESMGAAKEAARVEGDVEKYADLGGLEGDEARARAQEAGYIFNTLPYDGPVAKTGSFAAVKLPRIGANNLKRQATGNPYDGLRIKTPGKV